MKIKIKVTKEVLKRSAHCDGSNEKTSCAVAVAVREIFPFALVYQSGMCTIPSLENRKRSGDYYCDIRFPSFVFRWIKEFDLLTPEKRLNLPEFSFEIDVPSEVIEKIGIGEVYRILSESKTLEHVVEQIPVEKLA